MSRHYGLHHSTIKNTIKEFSSHTACWRKLGAKINSRLFLELCSIEEEMVTDLKQLLSSGELKPTFSDLLPVSVALDKASQQAMRAREDSEGGSRLVSFFGTSFFDVPSPVMSLHRTHRGKNQTIDPRERRECRNCTQRSDDVTDGESRRNQ